MFPTRHRFKRVSCLFLSSKYLLLVPYLWQRPSFFCLVNLREIIWSILCFVRPAVCSCLKHTSSKIFANIPGEQPKMSSVMSCMSVGQTQNLHSGGVLLNEAELFWGGHSGKRWLSSSHFNWRRRAHLRLVVSRGTTADRELWHRGPTSQTDHRLHKPDRTKRRSVPTSWVSTVIWHSAVCLHAFQRNDHFNLKSKCHIWSEIMVYLRNPPFPRWSSCS